MLTARYKIKIAKELHKEQTGLLHEFHHYRKRVHELADLIQEHDKTITEKLGISVSADPLNTHVLGTMQEKVLNQKFLIGKIKAVLLSSDMPEVLGGLASLFDSAKVRRPKNKELLEDIQHHLLRTILVFEASIETLETLYNSLDKENIVLRNMIAEVGKLSHFKGIPLERLLEQKEADKFKKLYHDWREFYDGKNPKGEIYLYTLFKDLYNQIYEDIEFTAKKCKEFLELIGEDPEAGFIVGKLKRVIYVIAFKILPKFGKTTYYILLIVIALRWDAYRLENYKGSNLELTPKGVVERVEELKEDPEHQEVIEEYKERPWWRILEKDPTVSEIEDEAINKIKREAAEAAEEAARNLPDTGVTAPIKDALTIGAWVVKHTATATTSVILLLSFLIPLLRWIILIPYRFATIPLWLIGRLVKRRLLK